MIKNIVFDFGGVLVQYDFHAFFTSVLGDESKAKWFLENVFPAEVNNEMDRGIHEPQYYIDWQKRLWPEYRNALDALNQRYIEIFTQESEGLREVMVELKEKGYRLLGLSNWSSKVYEVMDKFSIFEQLEDSLISKDMHMLKPHADIYQCFLDKFDVLPEECVFIDDKPENIEGARAAGFYGIVFKDTPSMLHELRPLLLPYNFERAWPQDETLAWEIVHQSAIDMEANGRKQWNTSYPPREKIAQDIREGNGYALRLDGETVGYAAVIFGVEPSYERLKGKWKSTLPYATIHRLAVAMSNRGKGLARLILTEAERLCRQRGVKSLRIDTNYDNVEMLHLLDNTGFKRCGMCYYERDGKQTERIAFEKVMLF